MIRRIIKIDEEKCIGCGLCAKACHEGAITMENGKAKLVKDDYCDGLGDCLPVCPTDAISFEEREAAAYDQAAVEARLHKQESEGKLPCGCPSHLTQEISRPTPAASAPAASAPAASAAPPACEQPSELRQWPVQIKLVPANAPYLAGAQLLIAADCTAYARGDFHPRFMKNRITLIGCPKLDDADYAAKLTAILKQNEIKSISVTRMQVPCCAGIVSAVQQAIQDSGKIIPWRYAVIAADGEIVEEN